MSLWALTRRPVLVLGVALLIAVGAGLAGALAPHERLQFLPVVTAVVLAWSMRMRDDPRERHAHRPPYLQDAGLLVAGTVMSTLTIVVVIAVVNETQVILHLFLLWGTFFSVGVLALGMRFTTCTNAAALLAVLQTALFTASYVFGPQGRVIGLIAKDSPPQLAWTVSIALWLAGLSLLAWGHPRSALRRTSFPTLSRASR